MCYWKTKLVPADAELVRMVESLTDRPCEPKNGGDHYFIEVNYEAHPEPEYIAAIWDAIDGRLGERLYSIKDDAERKCLFVRVRFSEERLPGFMYATHIKTERPEKGDEFCRIIGKVRALQVTRKNAERLLVFVGNGEMEIPKEDGKPAVFHFLNNGLSVWAHALEGMFVVYKGPGHFEVMTAQQFRADYER